MKKPFMLLLSILTFVWAELTIWPEDSVVTLEKRMILNAGDSLIIKPGCSIFADTSAGFLVQPGAYLLAHGTNEKPIMFSIKEEFKSVQGAQWKGVMCSGGVMKIKHVTVSGAYGGISWVDWDDKAYISNTHIKDCVLGISLSGRHNDTLHNILFEDCFTAIETLKKDSTAYISNITAIYTKGISASALIKTHYRGHIHLENSILVNTYGAGYIPLPTSTSTFYSNYNLYFTGQTPIVGEAPGPNDQFGIDPEFVNAEQKDFHLKPTSKAIDAGKPTSDYTQEPDNGGGCINLGYYGNTPEAALAQKHSAVLNNNIQSTVENAYIIGLDKEASLSIYSHQGRLLYSVNSGIAKTVNLQNLPLSSGSYIASLHGGNKSKSFLFRIP